MAVEKKQKKGGNSYSHFKTRGLVVAAIIGHYRLLSIPSVISTFHGLYNHPIWVSHGGLISYPTNKETRASEMKSLAWCHSSQGQSSALHKGLWFQPYNIHVLKKHLWSIYYMPGTVVGIENMGKYKHRQRSLPHPFQRHSHNHSCNGDVSNQYRWVREAQRHWEACSWSLRMSKGRTRCPDSWPLLAISPIFGRELLPDSHKAFDFLHSLPGKSSSMLWRAFPCTGPLGLRPGDPRGSAPGVQSCLGACCLQCLCSLS